MTYRDSNSFFGFIIEFATTQKPNEDLNEDQGNVLFEKSIGQKIGQINV